MIKVIALDLDGTLLTDDKKVTPENKKAIQLAKEQGVKIVLCTGRPLMSIYHLLEELELLGDDDFSINYNGGIIQKTKSQEILFKQGHSRDDMQYCYEEAYKVGLPLVMIDLERAYETTYPEGRPSIYPGLPHPIEFITKNPLEFEASHVFYKAVLCIEESLLDEGIRQLPEAFFEKFNCMKSRTFLLEVVPKEVSKGTGLTHLAEILGITVEEIAACGDEENDLSMLTTVGFPVAMGNGSPEVKEVAKFITKTNEESGVAHAIYHILEQNKREREGVK